MGRALLTEYGLAPITFGPSFTGIATLDAVGNSRWLSPELISPAQKRGSAPVTESKAADVYAFGMVVLEIFTGKIPFDQESSEAGVVLHISRGGKPKAPANAQELGLTNEMWHLLERCWHEDPKERPSMEEVVKIWRRFVKDDFIAECVLSGPLYPNTLSVLWSRRWTLVSLVTIGRLSFDHDKIQRVE